MNIEINRSTAIKIAAGFFLGVVAASFSVSVFFPKTSSDMAAWVQAIGAMIAIGAIWWQTNRQIAVDREARLHSSSEKYKGLLLRSIHSIRGISEFIEDKQMIVVMLNQKMSLIDGTKDEFAAQLAANAAAFKYLPFWDISEASLAIELQNVGKSLELLKASLDYSPGYLCQRSEELKLNCIQAISVFEEELNKPAKKFV